MYVENRAEITTILEGLQIFEEKSFGSYGVHIAQFRTYVCSFTKSSFVAIGQELCPRSCLQAFFIHTNRKINNLSMSRI